LNLPHFLAQQPIERVVVFSSFTAIHGSGGNDRSGWEKGRHNDLHLICSSPIVNDRKWFRPIYQPKCCPKFFFEKIFGNARQKKYFFQI
jgi:hypothetical protein